MEEKILEVGYLYFSKVDYDFIRQHFLDIFTICERYVSSRELDIELEVTDSQTDNLDNKILIAIGDSVIDSREIHRQKLES
ncbi:MAG: hypothetical protein MR028_08755 [Ligilactobacillus agilis]|uniref:hypothetical protein n=1 Tax=Ligilactobacillus agilis TaxID=1601 RepID=UPI00242D5424|nr:hypothetical protein [Ligilactobacillus agilis]MCI5762501.1 hypothetical protein [Ligilactobacillus agilis]